MKLQFIFVAMMACFIDKCQSNPIATEDVTETFVVNYLKHFGYMDPSIIIYKLGEQPNEESAFRTAIMTFQQTYQEYGLSVTGELDEATKSLIAMPRCGFTDNPVDLSQGTGDEDERRRVKRYETHGPGWDKTDLTYNIVQYTPDMLRTEVNSVIARAFAVWSAVTPLTFTKSSSGNADILISFAAGAHSNNQNDEPFDGPSNVLAHAFIPFNNNPIEGDAHFDEDEYWTTATYDGINLLQVAAHEFGHSLGLSHSTVSAALMAPMYGGYDPQFQLHTDDIQGLQSLYGPRESDPRSTPPTGSTTTSTLPDVPDFCSNPYVNAMSAYVEDGTLHEVAFRGSYYARLDIDSIVPGYPRKISDDWRGISGRIDAALYLKPWREQPAHTILFKGDRYYVYGDNRVLLRNKRLSVMGLPVDLSGIDAAYVGAVDGKIYLEKGSTHYKLKRRTNYNPARLLIPTSDAPIDSWVWNTVRNVHAVHKWSANNKLYLFKGNQYFKYNDDTLAVEEGYPRNIGTWWFGC